MADVFLVIGNGWSALSAVSTAVRLGGQVHWIQGSGMRMISPLPAAAAGASAQEWAEMALTAGIPLGAAQDGSFTREFRNRSFREPKWVAAPGVDRVEALPEEMLWAAEVRFASPWEARFETDLFELEERIRAALLESPQVHVTSGIPVTRVEFAEGGQGPAVSAELGSGEVIAGDWLIFADRLNDIRAITGMPSALDVEGRKSKILDLLRKWSPTGVLQVVFSHGRPLGEAVEEGFYTALQKEAGQEEERHAWGYFSGHSSVWTTGLAPEENEDNHQIAKRLRRIKQALGKTFDDPQWLNGAKEFSETVTDESVRFLEGFLFLEGKPVREPLRSREHERLFVLTDGFGPGPALEQAAAMAAELGRVPLAASSESGQVEQGEGAQVQDAAAPAPDEDGGTRQAEGGESSASGDNPPAESGLMPST